MKKLNEKSLTRGVGANVFKPRPRRYAFTLIEIMMVMIIIALLASMLLPTLKEAKTQAKFTRWFSFNRSCSNDPSCLINFNFQGTNNNPLSATPPGDVLFNSCMGTDSDGYSPKFYNGYLKNKNGGPHNFEWVRAGRYGKFKWALQFNGSDTYVLIPTTTAIDFTPYDGFTIMCWVKFDKLSSGDTIFSKSLWGTTTDAAAQYDMYYNGYAGSTGQGSFDVDAFETCGTWMDTDVNLNKAGWIHFTLRYKFVGKDAAGKPKGELMAFINGEALGDFIDTTNENPNTSTATGYQPCIDMQVPFILGAAGCYTKYWDKPNYDPDDDSLENQMSIRFNFQGLMDELLVYKRALSNKEVVNHYDMGKE